MFVIVFLLFLSICILAIYTVYKILEMEKDIETLYDNYSAELQKITKNNIKRSVLKC